MRVRAAGAVLLLAHLVLVGWLTLRPRYVPWVTAPNLELLAGIKADLALGPVEAARRICAGMVLLAPLGVLLPVAGGRLDVSPWGSLTRTVAAGAFVSVGIELFQTAVPGRVVDVDALLLNTAGVALAHLLVVPALRARLRRWSALRAGAGDGTARGGGRPSYGSADRPSYGSAQGPTRGSAYGMTSGRGGALRRDDPAQGPTPTIPRVGIAP
ncbi:VanZ family protein [Streptomyces sp. LP05-1]|uniref:VanZ family protein n=1 Tax=Streptomyces pyxinae TaxID=2970734 RepID=A0ABT2CJX5_9ACTN|nr:VanZ family protein [Streptomyces sp. LP05-1]MCS0637716.1 VanZ family protein [Streptomyces sp. LP05-1]